ncbi:uncharacterized protein CC84DRAFT_1161641 [Paraphaeosphaeria sporulosa]|uniref:Uncharacterized protein n=1 Tax=Paraphaeosphaeria sporulosa TaxID=1460663 RepID=A0A177CV96_9PLEO|nr:uncharacterized protein CC84DRAFT_1161641 [Paraphaeosphaeria sporulosa]OAG10790.1 hypothetical protein CC84DRAFT_1161641 [Paraphaeosphaeria sporulosa]
MMRQAEMLAARYQTPRPTQRPSRTLLQPTSLTAVFLLPSHHPPALNQTPPLLQLKTPRLCLLNASLTPVLAPHTRHPSAHNPYTLCTPILAPRPAPIPKPHVPPISLSCSSKSRQEQRKQAFLAVHGRGSAWGPGKVRLRVHARTRRGNVVLGAVRWVLVEAGAPMGW